MTSSLGKCGTSVQLGWRGGGEGRMFPGKMGIMAHCAVGSEIVASNLGGKQVRRKQWHPV